MTRKAARKQRQSIARVPQSAAAQPTSRWVAIGTMVASTAFTGLTPASASAREPVQGPSADQASAVYRFTVAPGPLVDVVAAFKRITGMTVTLTIDSIGSIQSPGVTGDCPPSRPYGRCLWEPAWDSRCGPPSRRSSSWPRSTRSVKVASPRRIHRRRFVAEVHSQPLRDTPQTLVVIPQAVLQEQGATSLRDALRNTPGITLTAGEGGTAPGDNLLIRGFSARNDVYIDGARDPGVVSRDTFNTEAVEVAKGPSSVTAGRGSTGGSVNLVTKAAKPPGRRPSVRLTGGNAEQKRGTLDVNRRLERHRRGAAQRHVAGRGRPGPRRGHAEGLGLRAVGRLRARTRRPPLTIGYQRLQQNNIPDYGLPGRCRISRLRPARPSTISTSATSTGCCRAITRRSTPTS